MNHHNQLVLRKSVDSFSAGTRVELVEYGTICVVEAPLTKVTRDHNIAYGHTTVTEKREMVQFEVSLDDLVELRSRSENVPVKNKRVRRAEKKRAMRILTNLAVDISTGKVQF